MRTRTQALVIAMLSVATVAVGLRLGAGSGVRTARVWGAPPSPRAGVLVWQVRAVRDAGGVTEPVQASLVVDAIKPSGTSTVRVKTDAAGVAEVELPNAQPGALQIRITEEDGTLLAAGPVTWAPVPWDVQGEPAWIRPTKEHGPLAIAVAPQGGRLVAGARGTLIARVSGGGPEVDLEVEPEPGLDVSSTAHVTACPSGWAAIDVTPLIHVTGLTLRAKDASGAVGEWFGAVPVAGGALFPEHVELERVPTRMWVRTSGEARPAYAEIVDGEGRWLATPLSLALAPEIGGDAPSDPYPRSALAVPNLPAGDYWLVLSTDPSGAERLSGATVAHPLHVGPRLPPCEALPLRARAATRGFPRWLALDGLATSRAAQANRRDHGRALAATGLLVGALLEVLLVLRAARRGRAAHALLEGDGEGAGAGNVAGAHETARVRAVLDVGIAILVVALGFALILALVLSAR